MCLSRGFCRVDNQRAAGVFRNPWDRNCDGFVRVLFFCVWDKTRGVGCDGVFPFEAVSLWLFCQRARVVFVILQSSCLCVRRVRKTRKAKSTRADFIDGNGLSIHCFFYADGQFFDGVLVWPVGECRAGIFFRIHTGYDLADGVYGGDGGRVVFALATGVFHHQKRNVKGLPHGKPLLV